MRMPKWLARLLAGLKRKVDLPDPPVVSITPYIRRKTMVVSKPIDPPLPEEKDKTDSDPAI